MNREMLYNDLSGFLAMHFPCKVQKISINAGFTCPNRDGSVGYGGCTYCNNQILLPALRVAWVSQLRENFPKTTNLQFPRNE